MKKLFGIISSFPEIKNGEYETIERIKTAGRLLGYDSIVFNTLGDAIENESNRSENEVAFVISLHFITPKPFKHFTYVALWNPLQFYFDWGYDRQIAHLLTYDDFLSCESKVADEHAKRLIAQDPNRSWNPPTFYHSLANPIIEPRELSSPSLFYCGINWERAANRHGRYHELFQRLDSQNLIRIYGPEVFLGNRPWRGFQNYAGEIPFDGESVVQRIAECGVALALSSDAHIESGLMSSRLYESCAAGAVVICDENEFCRTQFGETLLYIDGNNPIDEVYRQIRAHLDWIKSNPQAALQLAKASQKRFLEKFDMRIALRGMMQRHEIVKPQEPLKSSVLCIHLLNTFSEKSTATLVQNIQDNDDANAAWIIVVDPQSLELAKQRLEAANLSSNWRLYPLDDLERYFQHGKRKNKKTLTFGIGKAIESILSENNYDSFNLSFSNEQFFPGHLTSLAKALDNDPAATLAVADGLIQRKVDNDQTIVSVNIRENSHFFNYSPSDNLPGRLLFRRSVFESLPSSFLAGVELFADHLLTQHAARIGKAIPTLKTSCKLVKSYATSIDPRRIEYDRQVIIDLELGASHIQFPQSTNVVTQQIRSQSLQQAYPASAAGKVKQSQLPTEKPLPSVRLRNGLRSLTSVFKKPEQVAIFGCGMGGLKALETLKLNESPLCFFDNDPEKHGKSFYGYEIKAPTELIKLKYDKVLIASMYFTDIYEQLQELGVPPERISVHPFFKKT